MRKSKKEIIRKVEDILLNGGQFDKARRNILLDNGNCFLVQACPGSGKTTLLVAKLMFLAQTLDFSKDRICVLTHTNIAVDEIKKKIEKHRNKPGYRDFINNVYKLFDYPNHIGTIQSFLDKYLGIPGYERRYGFRPNVIDDDRVLSYTKNKFFSLEKGTRKYLNGGKYDNDIGIEKIFNSSFINGELLLTSKFGKKPPGKTSATYERILEIKIKQIEEYKYLKFKEIDYFSLKYLQDAKSIRGLLQKRFKYIFLDEIQDTHSLHVQILNEIYKGGDNIIQGFGDYNQEIFNSDGEEKGKFTIFGDTEKQINNSLRLSSIIAENIKNVSITPQELKGIIGRNIPIYFIIFDKGNTEKVIDKYIEIISKYERDFLTVDKDDLSFKAIGWVSKEKEEGKLNIGSYWKKYNNGKISKNKTDLFSYFQRVDTKEFSNGGYAAYKENIINGILHAFNHDKDNQILYRYKDKKTGIEKEKHFSKTTFIEYLKQNNLYVEFQKNVYEFSRQIQNDALDWDNVTKYILGLEIYSKKLKDGDFFRKHPILKGVSTISKDNRYSDQSITICNIETNIQFATIAKVKGETHTGTLVLDTDFYEQNTSKILEFLEINNIKNAIGERNQKGLSNHYVAITRATHLLCIAICKDHWKVDKKGNRIKPEKEGEVIFDEELCN